MPAFVPVSRQSKVDKKLHTLIDTNGSAHVLQTLNDSISMARLKRQDALVAAHNRLQAARLTGSAKNSPRKRTLVPVAIMSDTSPMPPMQSLRIGESEIDGIGNGSTNISPVSPAMIPTSGPGVANIALLTAGSVGMGARTLPLIKPREKRDMGGLLPKRSSVRTRHDQSVDFRRIHNPDDIPKNFRAVIQQKNNLRANAASSSSSSASGATSRGFDGILPG